MVQKLWSNVHWLEDMRNLVIATKELLPILIVCTVWGHRWVKHRVWW